jgi:hypothetical protein
MRSILNILILGLIIAGCTASDLPTLEDSQRSISELQTRLEMMDEMIDAMPHPRQLDRDMEVRIDTRALDRILHAVSHNRSDDIRISLPAMRHLIEQKKHALGIPYTNYVDIDSGKFNLNIKEFRIVTAENNSLRIFMSIAGKGRISVSGKYIAVPASATPTIKIQAEDTIRFVLKKSSEHGIALVPQKQNIPLEITVSIRLLAWDVPYKHNMSIAVDKIIQPIPIPLYVSSTLSMPALKSSPDQALRFVKSKLNISGMRTGIINGWIHSAANLKLDTALVR